MVRFFIRFPSWIWILWLIFFPILIVIIIWPGAICWLFGFWCPEDTVEVTKLDLNENGILVDGFRNGGFQNDEGFLGSAGSVIRVGNYTDQPGEVTAFTKKHPPTMLWHDASSSASTTQFWTPGSDYKAVPLRGEFKIPVKIWIVSTEWNPQQPEIRLYRVYDAVRNANEIFEAEGLGVRLDLTPVAKNPEDVTKRTNGSTRNFFDFSSCPIFPGPHNIQSDVGFTAGMINIYLVYSVDGNDHAGLTCTGPDPTTANEHVIGLPIYMSTSLLAHEIGHALNLGHVGHLAGHFGSENIMHESSATRQHLTEGQTFRAVFNDFSALNKTYGLAQALLTPRQCDLFTAEDTWPTQTQRDRCPLIERRLWADGAWPADP